MGSEIHYQLLRVRLLFKRFYKALFKRPVKVIILREDQVLVKHRDEWYVGDKKAMELKPNWEVDTDHSLEGSEFLSCSDGSKTYHEVAGFDNFKPTFKPRDSVGHPSRSSK